MKNQEHYARIETLESFVYKTAPLSLFTLPKKLNLKDGSGVDEITIDLPVTNILFKKISFDKPFIPIGIGHITIWSISVSWAGAINLPSYIYNYKGTVIVTEADIDIDTHVHEVNWQKTNLLSKFRFYNSSAYMYKYDYPENEMLPPGEYIFGMAPNAWDINEHPEGLTIQPFEFHYLQKQ